MFFSEQMIVEIQKKFILQQPRKLVVVYKERKDRFEKNKKLKSKGRISCLEKFDFLVVV